MHRLPPSSTRPHTLCPSTTRFRSMSNAQQTHIPLIFSEPGLDIAGPVGLDDVRGLILAALGASPVSRGIGGPVFQYIGSLESPSSIGLAGPDGTYLTLDLQRRSEEHTSELQSLMRTSYAVFCLKKKKKSHTQ